MEYRNIRRASLIVQKRDEYAVPICSTYTIENPSCNLDSINNVRMFPPIDSFTSNLASFFVL